MGSEVHIDMYDDRLEIFSPGGMFDGINVQDRDIMTVPSERRNPIIADVFQRLVYMERRGSGFKKIIEDYQFQKNYTEELAPILRSKYGSFFLTLKNLNYALKDKDQFLSEKGTEKGTNQGTKKRTEVEERIETGFEAIKANPTITQAALVSQLGISLKQAKNATEELKKKGRICREGNNRKGRCIITD